jgi:UPF0042 nucleotide-binding protein
MTARSRITLVTFGFKYGPPPANHYFDVSFLANPARDPRWGLFSRPDEEMRAFVTAQPAAAAFVERVVPLIEMLTEVDDDLRIGLGCNAGRHRSVLLARIVAEELERRGHSVHVVHREREFDELARPADAATEESPSTGPNALRRVA